MDIDEQIAGVEPATEPAWYWYDQPEDQASGWSLNGPFATKAEAEAAAPKWATFAEYKRREIDCRVFDIEAIWAAFIERNAEAVWDQMPPDEPEGEDALRLRDMLAATFHRFLTERGTFTEFRALDQIVTD